MKLKRLDTYLKGKPTDSKLAKLADLTFIEITTFEHFTADVQWLHHLLKDRKRDKGLKIMAKPLNSENAEDYRVFAPEELLIKEQEKIDKAFERLIDSWQTAHEKDVNNFSNIPFGYGSRSYHRFKSMVYHADRVKVRIQDFATKYKPSEILIEKAKRLNIL